MAGVIRTRLDRLMFVLMNYVLLDLVEMNCYC